MSTETMTPLEAVQSALDEAQKVNPQVGSVLACEECGCLDVQYMGWINGITGEANGDDCGGGASDNWCPKCENHPRFCYLTIKDGKVVCEDHGADEPCDAREKAHRYDG